MRTSCRQQPAPPHRNAAKMSPRISIGPEPVLAVHALSPPAAGSHCPAREGSVPLRMGGSTQGGGYMALELFVVSARTNKRHHHQEEIARYAEGSKNALNGRRYCLPANCFAQYANDVDISDEDPELRGFKERFFPQDEHISNLCKVIFRHRKICAFCRKAKEYELRDETGQVIEGGDSAKIKELRDSILPDDKFSKYVLVPTANMQHSANELFVSALPCVPIVNQFFVADPLSALSEEQRCLASTTDTRTSGNHFFV
jgi:hypothetical protein